MKPIKREQPRKKSTKPRLAQRVAKLGELGFKAQVSVIEEALIKSLNEGVRNNVRTKEFVLPMKPVGETTREKVHHHSPSCTALCGAE
jgi:hypothetical protein